ncbi:MAG: hypothetical protein WB778_05815 [Thermoplasmata archaeon]
MGHSTTRRVLAILLPAVLVLPALLFAAAGSYASTEANPAAMVGSNAALHVPPTIAPQIAWDGIAYNKSCASCLIADTQVASAPGYVFEMVNGSYSVWTPTETLLVSNTLDSLFNAGSDELANAQVRYDTPDQRWFVSADDLHSNNILYGTSESSDPTGTWNIQHFNLGGGEIPNDTSLAVNAINVVVSTDLYSRFGGAYLGAQVWVANKSQLVGGGGVATWSSAPETSEQALVPAEPAAASKSMYLVSDGNGSSSAIELFTLTGSPPATPTLSVTANFASTTVQPPNALQANSSELVGVGDGQIVSAIWRSGTLWAAATNGCVPSGDSVTRSCLHVWEISTVASTLSQDFEWSTGAGTYDFYPALATNGTGQLTVVFGESSATLDPSVFVTGQTIADPAGSLEPSVLLKKGLGPDAPTTGCSAGVCPFGAEFGAAFEPFSGDRYWIAGEYTGSDSSTNFWSTWVAQVSNVVAYPVTFSEAGLPTGSTWTVTVNGVPENSSSSIISFLEPNGTYSFTVGSPILSGNGTRYLASPTTGSFVVTTSAVAELVNFTKQFRLTTTAIPLGSGTVDPSSSWWAVNASVLLGGLANTSHAFASWAGSGLGSYNGSENPVSLTMAGPITETATFVNESTYRVSFTAAGLPAGTNWTVAVNGLQETSTSASQAFNLTNGSFTYALESPIAGTTGIQYTTAPAGGTFVVQGASVAIPVAYTTQYELTTRVAPAGSGSVSPASAWYNASQVVNVSALPAAGYSFGSWTGVGSGSYSGASDPALVTMEGAVTETASFQQVRSTMFSVTLDVAPAGSGSIFFEGQRYFGAQTVSISAGTYAISAQASTGWDFSEWELGGKVSVNASGADVTGVGWINATFIPVDKVSIVTDPTGCGSISIAGGVYASGASLDLGAGSYAIAANACGSYALVSLEGQGGVTVSDNQITVAGNGSVIATFSMTTSSGASSGVFGSQVPLWLLIVAIGLLYATLAVLYFEKRRSPPRGGSASSTQTSVAPTVVAASTGATALPPWSEESDPSPTPNPTPSPTLPGPSEGGGGPP